MTQVNEVTEKCVNVTVKTEESSDQPGTRLGQNAQEIVLKENNYLV